MLNTISLDEQIATEPETILDDEQKNDYTAFDRLISKMKLTAVEYETLSILMAGFTMLQIEKNTERQSHDNLAQNNEPAKEVCTCDK